MSPTPDETLRILGSTIRTTRVARGLTQQRLAKLARVSRSQIAAVERGANVSLRFFLKLARYLELPLFGGLDAAGPLSTGRNVSANAFEMMRSLELLAAIVDYMRDLTVDAVLPALSRQALRDAPALKQFVDRHAATAEGMARLEDALFRFSGEHPLPQPATLPEGAAAPRRRKERAR